MLDQLIDGAGDYDFGSTRYAKRHQVHPDFYTTEIATDSGTLSLGTTSANVILNDDTQASYFSGDLLLNDEKFEADIKGLIDGTRK